MKGKLPKNTFLSKKQRKELTMARDALLNMKNMLEEAKVIAFKNAGMDGYSNAIIFKGDYESI